MYRRAATHWHQRRVDGRVLLWIDGDEGTGRRLVSYQGVNYGAHKWDRLPMDEAPASAQALAVCEPSNRCDWHTARADRTCAGCGGTGGNHWVFCPVIPAPTVADFTTEYHGFLWPKEKDATDGS